ncbi:MAG: spore coat protein CotJB [Clostridia bacterium]|nr:spore coat protein CotJB [Clostridia bacterium]
MMNNSREKMLKAYQAYSFAAHEALLYLDAYPKSREAQEYYNKYQRLAQKAKAEYESKYGYITPPAETKDWQWTSSPWPWQIEGGK